MFRLLLVAVIVSLSIADDFIPIGYKDCKSGFKLNSVTASGCILKEEGQKKICILKKGSNPTIRINFTPNEEATTLKTYVKAKIDGSMLDFPLTDDNACNFGLPCPLKAGQEYTYEQGMEIIDNYPENRAQVKWVVNREKEGKGDDLCIIFLAEIAA